MHSTPGSRLPTLAALMGQLDNQTAVVTGAGRGIGHAIALRLAKDGARIAVVSRQESNAQRTAASQYPDGFFNDNGRKSMKAMRGR